MKKWLFLLMVILIIPTILIACGTPTPTPSTTTPPPTTSANTPIKGGVLKTIMTRPAVAFGYPPRIQAGDANYANPFFDRLLSIGDGGVYKPMLALSWETAADGKSITFKLRKGVKFHDNTDFNATAVKYNYDLIIPPKSTILDGVSSIDVIDDYTVRINLKDANSLVLYQLGVDFRVNIASPTALQANGLDWADTHPVGTGPFMLKSYERNASLTYVKNPNYWEEGLPYLDEMVVTTIQDPMTQMASFKAGEANQIYDAVPTIASQLRDEGWTLMVAPGTVYVLSMDTKSPDSIFAKQQVREAIEYAVDKEALYNGPGLKLYEPIYQVAVTKSTSYNPTSTPRKYNPAKAKELLAAAGYPNGFSFKGYFQDTTWKDGVAAVQSYLAAVGIKMDINYVTSAAINQIRGQGAIEKGAAAQMTLEAYSNHLFTLNRYFRTNSPLYSYIVRPTGIDALFDQALLAKDPAAQAKITQQITKSLYDNETVVPLWLNPRIAVLDKKVQNPGWFVDNDSNNHMFGRYTWLKK